MTTKVIQWATGNTGKLVGSPEPLAENAMKVLPPTTTAPTTAAP